VASHQSILSPVLGDHQDMNRYKVTLPNGIIVEIENVANKRDARSAARDFFESTGKKRLPKGTTIEKMHPGILRIAYWADSLERSSR
jgi:hypothetical protein